jgi:hypothetical protein
MEWMLGFAAAIPIGAVMFCCYMKRQRETEEKPLIYWHGLSERQRRHWEIEGCIQLASSGPAATSIVVWLRSRVDYLNLVEGSMGAELYKCKTPSDVLELREKYGDQLVDRIGNACWFIRGCLNE